MKSSPIRKWKVFWPWQDLEEECWLEESSQRGEHLVGPLSFYRYTFSQGEPANFRYRLDYRDEWIGKKGKKMDEYLSLMGDAGWSYLGDKSGWLYFRRIASPNEPMELFTDAETKLLKYKRYLASISVIIPAYLLMAILLVNDPANWWMLGLFSLFAAYWLFAAGKILRRMKQLKPL